MKVITGIFISSENRGRIHPSRRLSFKTLPNPFFVKLSPDRPARREGNIVFLDCTEGDDVPARKLWFLCDFLLRSEEFDYLFQLDESANVSPEVLDAFLKKLGAERPSLTHHMGTRFPLPTVPRTATWHVGGESGVSGHNERSYVAPIGAGGTGYIVSRRAVEIIVERGREHFLNSAEPNEHKIRTEFLQQHGFFPTLMPAGVFLGNRRIHRSKEADALKNGRLTGQDSASDDDYRCATGNRVKNKLGIVFLHHRVDAVTLNNLQSFRRWNPDATIVTMSANESLPEGYSIQRMAGWVDRWRKQTAKPGLRARSTDILVYAWYHNRLEDCEKWLLVEWDSYCACPVEEYFGMLMEKDLVASTVHLQEDGGNWSWFRKSRSLPEGIQSDAAGVVPFSLVLISDSTLSSMCKMLPCGDLGDGNGELRFASLARACGVTPHPNPFAPGKNGWSPLRRGTLLGRGMWHPVKWLSDPPVEQDRRSSNSENGAAMQIYRIMPPMPRSPRAMQSQKGLHVTEVPWVTARGSRTRDKELAASSAHAHVMEEFLKSSAGFAVVLEDDAILNEDRSWMGFREFDLFLPYAQNRAHLAPDSTVRQGVLPKYGTFAYLCSRQLAVAYLSLLRTGRVADHALQAAAAGMRTGSFAGNLVNHDNQCSSLISEHRRRQYAHIGAKPGSVAIEAEPANPIQSGESPRFLIGICSCHGNEDKRNSIRDTWLQTISPNVEARFFIGGGESESADTTVVEAPDDYKHLPAKVRAFFRYALEHFAFDWLFKCDDDTYVAIERILTLAGESALVGNEFLSQRGSASGGAGYLLSRAAVELLVEDDSLPESGDEDVILTGELVRRGLPWRATRQLCWNAKRAPLPGNDVITSHWLSAKKMRALHAMFTASPAMEAEVKHPCWSDRLAFYEEGTFTRRKVLDYGRWSRIDDERLRLEWFDWEPETMRLENNMAHGFIDRTPSPALSTDASSDDKLTPSGQTRAEIATDRPTLLIGICSCAKMSDRREAVRQTWFARIPIGVRAVFFVGNCAEQSEPDVVRLDADDDYERLPAKVLEFFRYAIEHEKFDYLFKCDDDTYVDTERLTRLMSKGFELVGHDRMEASGFASSGAGYLLSRKMVAYLARQNSFPTTGWEDQIFPPEVLRQTKRVYSAPGLPGNQSAYPRRGNQIITAHPAPPAKLRMIDAGLYRDPVRVVDAIHRGWKDRLSLYEGGWFMRTKTFCGGRWTEESEGRLVLDWFDWDREVFRRGEDGRYHAVNRGVAFNGDPNIRKQLEALITRYGVKLAFETGTHAGDTSWSLGEIVERVKTVEVDAAMVKSAKQKLAEQPNIEVCHGDSAVILGGLLAGVREPTLFYLDAHWRDKWPLLDELRAIAQSEIPAVVIAIHDFKVGGLGYDSYGGKDLDFDYVQSAIREIFPEGFTWETNHTGCAAGKRRGVGYFHGNRRDAAKCICVRLIGRMGNQMFQYAHGLAVARATGRELRLIPRHGVEFSLGAFGLNPIPDCQPGVTVSESGGYQSGMELQVIENVKNRTDRVVWLEGYFQNPAFFATVADEVRTRFIRPATGSIRKNSSIRVGVQIRRGDFVGSKVHSVCQDGYYFRAIEWIRARFEHVEFVVTSDDPAWCTTKFASMKGIEVMPKQSAVEALQTLMGCDALIISNSSFGWWAAWLSGSDTVICPDRFLAATSWDVGMPEWLRISGDGRTIGLT